MKSMFFSLLLCIILVFNIVGCSNNEDANGSAEIDSLEAEETGGAISDQAVSKIDNEGSEIDSDKALKEIDKREEDEFNGEPIILRDSDDIYIEFQGIYEQTDTTWGIDLYIENNSEEEIVVVLNNTVINGCSFPISNDYNTISPDTKYLSSANYGYIIDIENLEKYAIGSIKTIEFNLWVAPDSQSEAIIDQPVKIELDKDVPNISDTEEIEKGEVIFDEENVYVEYRGVHEYYEGMWVIDLYIENNRDSEITFNLVDSKINKYSVTIGNAYVNIPANSRYLSFANYSFLIDDETLELYDITEIDSLDFKIEIKSSITEENICETEVSLSLDQSVQ